MVHGESGGGGKIGTLLGMPKASGLFHRAILQSGTANRMPAKEQAARAEMLLKELQLSRKNVRQIQQLPYEQIVAAASKWKWPLRPDRAAALSQHGHRRFTHRPIDAVANGSAKIPIVVGCTKHEMALMLRRRNRSREDYRRAAASSLQGMVGAKAPDLLKGYRANHPDYSAGDLLVRIMSDTAMRMGAIDLAEAHIKAGGAPTYMYLFTWESRCCRT